MSESIYGGGPLDVPLTSLPAGVLTREILRNALDALWNPAPYEPSPWEQAIAREAQALSDAIPRPDPEWAITADGWRLVVYDGAIVGIEEAR